LQRFKIAEALYILVADAACFSAVRQLRVGFSCAAYTAAYALMFMI